MKRIMAMFLVVLILFSFTSSLFARATEAERKRFEFFNLAGWYARNIPRDKQIKLERLVFSTEEKAAAKKECTAMGRPDSEGCRNNLIVLKRVQQEIKMVQKVLKEFMELTPYTGYYLRGNLHLETRGLLQASLEKLQEVEKAYLDKKERMKK